MTLNDNRYHVAAGNYYVDAKKPLILEAYLGTCVGVACYDPVAGIGGIIHLLLPEPISGKGVAQPEKYATIGFPMFLDALIKAGASADNMKACIAGGALVGPVDDSDLELDIGGRTTERVMQLVAAKNIEIEKLETGGYFTCRLTLDMDSWKCAIDPAGFDKLSGETDIKVPNPGEIARSVENLQPIPQIALKVLRIFNEEPYEIKQVTDEIRKDQVIAARTLRLCNSAFVARRHRIDSIDHALVMLGQQLFLKLVISAALNSFFSQTALGYSLCKGGIFHHAVGAAVIAEKLAAITGITEPSSAYTAGLLHDIGKVALDQFIDSSYPLFYRELNEEGKNFSEIEKQVLGTDHTEVGADLARKWSFPETLVAVIRHHHKPEEEPRDNELVHLVYLADLLMSRFRTGLELERLGTDALAKRLQSIGLSIGEFPRIVDDIPARVLESSPELAMMV